MLDIWMLLLLGACCGTITSVSYTHLDVYKRQVERFWDQEGRLPPS